MLTVGVQDADEMPGADLRAIARAVEIEFHPTGTVLLEQGDAPLDHQAKYGPPDWPGTRSLRCSTRKELHPPARTPEPMSWG